MDVSAIDSVTERDNGQTYIVSRGCDNNASCIFEIRHETGEMALEKLNIPYVSKHYSHSTGITIH